MKLKSLQTVLEIVVSCSLKIIESLNSYFEYKFVHNICIIIYI